MGSQKSALIHRHIRWSCTGACEQCYRPLHPGCSATGLTGVLGIPILTSQRGLTSFHSGWRRHRLTRPLYRCQIDHQRVSSAPPNSSAKARQRLRSSRHGERPFWVHECEASLTVYRCGCTGVMRILCSQVTYRHLLREGRFASAQQGLRREWMFSVTVVSASSWIERPTSQD